MTGPGTATLTWGATAPLSRYLRNRVRHKTSREMQTALAMTVRLSTELEQMIEEHEAAVSKLRKLSERYARLAGKTR